MHKSENWRRPRACPHNNHPDEQGTFQGVQGAAPFASWRRVGSILRGSLVHSSTFIGEQLLARLTFTSQTSGKEEGVSKLHLTIQHKTELQ